MTLGLTTRKAAIGLGIMALLAVAGCKKKPAESVAAQGEAQSTAPSTPAVALAQPAASRGVGQAVMMPALAAAPARGIVAAMLLAGAVPASAEIVVHADRGSGAPMFRGLTPACRNATVPALG